MMLRAGGRRCAIPAARVRQILSPVELMPVPNAPAHILGKIAAEDDCLSVFDLGVLLGAQPARTDSGTRLLVVRVLRQGWDGWHALVLRVERVDGLVRREGESPRSEPGADPWRAEAALPASVRHGGEEVPLLDLDWLLDIPRLASLADPGRCRSR
jgi:purine-binding chemotaxis protein CheW